MFCVVNIPCKYILYTILVIVIFVYLFPLFCPLNVSPDVILCGWLGLKHQLINSFEWLIGTVTKTWKLVWNNSILSVMQSLFLTNEFY